MLIFRYSEEEENVEVYLTNTVHEEIIRAMLRAASKINKKSRKKKASLYNVLRNKFSKNAYDELVAEEDAITKMDQDATNVDFSNGPDNRKCVSFIFADTLDDSVKSQWFHKTITVFKRTQNLYFMVDHFG